VALIDVPDEEGWRDVLASRLLLLMLGAVVLQFGLQLWGLINEIGVVGAIPTFVAFALGVQLLVVATTDIDLERYGRPIAYVTTAVLAVLVCVVVMVAELPRLGTDVLAFTSYSVELAADGTNPFAASMVGSHALPDAPDMWTPRTDGSIVDSWSYPGGTLWVYSLQYGLVGRLGGLRLTSLVGTVLVAWLVTAAVPAEYATLGPLSILVAQNELLAALGGLNDMWWVAPTIGTVWLWAIDRRVAAAAVFGVACAMKQQPWAIGLPLAIWVWHTAPDARTFARRAATYIGVGLTTFTALNLPWLLADPGAWLGSVLTPLSTGAEAPLVSRGVGLAILNQAADGRLVTRGTFELLIYVTVAVGGLAYWRWFEQLRWAAWLFPAVVFLWTPRSLPSYFHWFVPIAVVATVAAHGRLRGQTPEVTPA